MFKKNHVFCSDLLYSSDILFLQYCRLVLSEKEARGTQLIDVCFFAPNYIFHRFVTHVGLFFRFKVVMKLPISSVESDSIQLIKKYTLTQTFGN